MQQLDNLIVNENVNIIEAWKKMNNNVKQIVFVVNDSNKLVGVITDGDIRRFLIDSEEIRTQVKNVMNKNFVYANVTDSHEELLNKTVNEAKIIPIVDAEFKVVDYFEYNIGTYFPIAIPNLGGNEYKYLLDAFLSTWISSKGSYIKRFEDGFAKYCDTDHGIAVSNGTVALHLALVALGIKEGDEVIIPDLTFAATANAVLYTGAKPVIVDIEEDSWCICPNEIEKAITAKTKAIIPVHLYGQPCDMEKIMTIAKRHNLYVIEDCAEAHGAEFKNQKVGSFGDVGCFSFFANKVITTGEGGICITQNKELALKMQQLRDHGMSLDKKYWHDVVGYNYRMTNLQAAIGLAQLERIEIILKEKEELENLYKEKLRNYKNLTFQKNDLKDRKKITWMISALYTGDMEKLMNFFKEHKIETRNFFYPLSEMPIYKEYVFSGVNSQKIAKLGINFPTHKLVNIEFIHKIGKVL